MSFAVLADECAVDSTVDTVQVIRELRAACPGPLYSEHRRDLDALCRKIHVAGVLLARYDCEYRKPANPQPLAAEHWPAVIDALLAWSEALLASDRGLSLKLLNATYAAADLAGIDSSRADALLEQSWGAGSLSNLSVSETTPRISDAACAPLDLTVLAYEGPCARAYLAMMRRAGLRPRKIVLLVLNEHPQSHKPVGRWFPGRLRTWYAEKSQDITLNYWPRRIRSMHPELVRAAAEGLASIIDRPAELIDHMYGPFRYEDYADEIHRVPIRSLRDDALYQALNHAAPDSHVLFTGGGLLSARVIDLPGLKFLHVHPGHLPYVRGADGLLWSTLVRGQPSMSCFYLASGLDTGDVLRVADYAPLRFKTAGTFAPQTLYRAVFSFIDPLLRAHLLVHSVLNAGDLSALAAQPQNPDEGITYHFMHPRLRNKVLNALFA